jgi:hypothetical protein
MHSSSVYWRQANSDVSCRACNAHEELRCLGCLVDHCMSFAKGSRVVVVLRFSCIYWYCVMRLTGVKDLDSLGGVYSLPSQLSHTRELRNG